MRSVECVLGRHSCPALQRSHRTAVMFVAKFGGAAALALSVAIPLAHAAAAEDSGIVLTASASEVGATPGSAYAQGYVAMATAGQDIGAATVGASSAAVAMPDGVTGAVADTPVTEEDIGLIGRCPRC